MRAAGLYFRASRFVPWKPEPPPCPSPPLGGPSPTVWPARPSRSRTGEDPPIRPSSRFRSGRADGARGGRGCLFGQSSWRISENRGTSRARGSRLGQCFQGRIKTIEYLFPFALTCSDDGIGPDRPTGPRGTIASRPRRGRRGSGRAPNPGVIDRPGKQRTRDSRGTGFERPSLSKQSRPSEGWVPPSSTC